MNPRIDRLSGEIERTKQKIAGYQAKLKGLEEQKTELENAEYVALIRQLDMTPAQLAAFLKKHTHGGDKARTAPAGANIQARTEVPSDKENIKE
jgi:cupin superfamily acireductone dioxygenase involved in methionine salvage